MCYWGEAYALGPNINVPMMPEAVAPAFAAIARAVALQDGAAALSSREAGATRRRTMAMIEAGDLQGAAEERRRLGELT